MSAPAGESFRCVSTTSSSAATEKGSTSTTFPVLESGCGSGTSGTSGIRRLTCTHKARDSFPPVILAPMQITPGVGIPGIQIGATRAEVESAVGTPNPSEESRAFYFDREPNYSVHYAHDGTVELIEVFHAQGRDEVFLDDIQLTFRLMDDVQADLERAGFTSRPIGIGLVFDAGFTLWSMASLSPSDLVPGAEYDPEDERHVVEGVGIAPASYWQD